VIIGWALRNAWVGGTATNRILVWHPTAAANLDMGLRSVSLFMPVEPWRQALMRAPVFSGHSIVMLGSILAWISPHVYEVMRCLVVAHGGVLILLNALVCLWLPGVNTGRHDAVRMPPPSSDFASLHRFT
jgi:hypothetical protein